MSILQDVPAVGSRWQHRGGQFYIVQSIANAATTNTKYPVTVVYVNEDTGKVFSRPADDWHRSLTYAPMQVEPPSTRRLKALQRACGYVENGTDTMIRLFQDDATREWMVQIGIGNGKEQGFHSDSFEGAIDKLADWLDANPED